MLGLSPISPTQARQSRSSGTSPGQLQGTVQPAIAMTLCNLHNARRSATSCLHNFPSPLSIPPLASARRESTHNTPRKPILRRRATLLQNDLQNTPSRAHPRTHARTHETRGPSSSKMALYALYPRRARRGVLSSPWPGTMMPTSPALSLTCSMGRPTIPQGGHGDLPRPCMQCEKESGRPASEPDDDRRASPSRPQACPEAVGRGACVCARERSVFSAGPGDVRAKIDVVASPCGFAGELGGKPNDARWPCRLVSSCHSSVVV